MNAKLPIHFAPLQGHTEAIYRQLHAKYFGGIECYHTPFIRLQDGVIRNKDQKESDPELNHSLSLIPQILASELKEAATLVKFLKEKGYTQIDINMGCPFPLIARKKKGSGILPFPEKVREVLQIVAEEPDISFSVKMRLGQESAEESLRLLPLLNELPLRRITLHPRLGIQQYKGETDIESFSRFYEACHLSLLYNGDLHTIEDITTITERFPGLAGVMIGRGLLANPALALEYQQERILPGSELISKLSEMHRELFDWYNTTLWGESQILLKVKSFWEYLLPDAEKRLRKKILKSTTVPAYLAATQRLFEELSAQG
ncbi:MAG: tRNA-dihydrouridine synthase family protein [Bacteroides sp.]|nr:tRNA-dihydrouridine synthase family protein [Bacteroides sp.]